MPAHKRQVFAAKQDLPINHVGRHTVNIIAMQLPLQLVVHRFADTRLESLKTIGVNPGGGNTCGDNSDIFNIELSTPKGRIDRF